MSIWSDEKRLQNWSQDLKSRLISNKKVLIAEQFLLMSLFTQGKRYHIGRALNSLDNLHLHISFLCRQKKSL